MKEAEAPLDRASLNPIQAQNDLSRSMLYFALFLHFFVALSPINSRAQTGPQETLPSTSNIENLVIETNDQVILRGVRLRDSKSRIPVLLVPGFAEDSRYFKTLAESLFETGHFETWTVQMRGLGASHRRSLWRTDGETRHFGFDAMVGFDIPAMVREIYLKTGRKVLVVAHSLGGMAAGAALSGARMGDKGIYLDKSEKNRRWWKRRVRGFLSLGAPVSFDHGDPIFEAWSRSSFITNHIVRLLAVDLTLDPLKPAKALSGLIKATYLKITESVIHESPIRFPLTDGYVNPARLSLPNGELFYYLTSVLSDVEPQLRRDVTRWRQEGFSANNGFLYKGLPLPQVPSLIASGEKDALIPRKQFQEHWEARRKNNYRLFQNLGDKVQIVEVSRAGHVDVAYGTEAVKEISSVLTEGQRGFMSSSKALEKMPKPYRRLPKSTPCSLLF